MTERNQTLSFTRGRLPHWLVAGQAYFVTLCRKGCLPARVVAEMRIERAERAVLVSGGIPGRAHGAAGVGGPGRSAVQGKGLVKSEALEAQRRRFLKIDAILDAASRSERDLCEPAVSEIVLKNLDWLRGCGWRVWAVTLMPSHVHLVLSNTAGRSGELTGDLARFMAYTARLINKARGGSGAFWQREPFDHWCREGDAWLRSVSYTVNNPVKAGLCAAWREWPHTVADPEAEGLMP